MSVRRRGAAAVSLAVAAALALTACGGGATDTKSEQKDSGDKKAVAQGGKDFGDAAAKTAAYGTDAKAGQFPRTLTHAMGRTELKAAPDGVSPAP